MIFAHPEAAVAALEQQFLPIHTKGLALSEPLQQSAIGKKNLHILDGSVSYPVAVLKDSALQHNLHWMQQFAQTYRLQLAPHGKTTLSPQLFAMQLAAGAWGITLATVPQVQMAYSYGVRRIFIANQIVAPADIAVLAKLLANDPALEIYVLVDSLEGIQRLATGMQQFAPQRTLFVLVELGVMAGRTGVRTLEHARELAENIANTPGLILSGVECYEGLWVSQNRSDDLEKVQHLLQQLLEFTEYCDAQHWFKGEQIVISAGGSAYFDFVAQAFKSAEGFSRPVQRVLRSGCYLTHDHGFYFKLEQAIAAREGYLPESGLQPALELWAMVQSTPETGLAIITLGKRDASYDIDLPIPLFWYRHGEHSEPQPLNGAVIRKMNDQHGYLQLPADLELKVGDLVGLGISHPCTTFDKWRTMLIVDDSYSVKQVINTFF